MFVISLPVILSTFGIIFLAELPDKTAFASLLLATKYRARSVIFGAGLAFLMQTLVAVFAGSLLTLFPAKPIHILSGVIFLVFAYIAFREKEEIVEKEEALSIKQISRKHQPAWLKSFFVVFAAEWGDLTQFATVALIARFGQPLSVSIGAIGALWLVTIIAVIAGSKLSTLLTQDRLNIISGFLFLGIGVFIILTSI